MSFDKNYSQYYTNSFTSPTNKSKSKRNQQSSKAFSGYDNRNNSTGRNIYQTGVYEPDINNPPSVSGGVAYTMSSPKSASAYAPIKLPPSFYGPSQKYPASFSVSQAETAAKSNPTIPPYPTRRSTTRKFELSELQKMQPLSYGQFQVSPYFKQPVVPIQPNTSTEQFLENTSEKYCRCILHVAASYLDRMAAAQASDDEKKYQSESEKFYRVPYAVCNMHRYGPLRQLRKQGLDITGIPSGECGANYDLNNIPTKELYALALLRSRSKINQKWLNNQTIPQYENDTNYLESIRPQLLEILQAWQNQKPISRAPPHYRNF